MDNNLLTKLIDKCVEDDARKELYLKALPAMTEEEQIRLSAGLMEMLMKKLHRQAAHIVEDMVEEMAADDSVKYEKVDFQGAYDAEVTRYLANELEVTEEDDLQKLRESLKQIGAKVEEHDQVLSKFKDKFSEEV